MSATKGSETASIITPAAEPTTSTPRTLAHAASPTSISRSAARMLSGNVRAPSGSLARTTSPTYSLSSSGYSEQSSTLPNRLATALSSAQKGPSAWSTHTT
eukprot:scaffold179377_cov30-Tisochrysis_lutea.AAC.1